MKRAVFPLLVLLCTGCLSQEVQEREPEEAAAVRAQMDVRTALLEDEQVSAAPVRVEYAPGILRLEGYVETEAERERAGEIAANARPNLEVINNLEVWQWSE